MKRKIAIAAGILVTAVSTISGSYAYYQDSVTVTNHISTGDVNIGIQEYEKDGDTEKVYAGPKEGIVLPSQTISKIPRITNYAETCYIRVKTTYSGEAADSVSNIDTEPEVLNPADVAEFKSRMIEHFRRKDTLQQSLLELQELYENGPILERIEKALTYSQRSRYRDFETTLDILFEGMDAETLRDDLLRMEVLRYRRLPYRQENTTGNLV